jgi:hypothetical protein
MLNPCDERKHEVLGVSQKELQKVFCRKKKISYQELWIFVSGNHGFFYQELGILLLSGIMGFSYQESCQTEIWSFGIFSGCSSYQLLFPQSSKGFVFPL